VNARGLGKAIESHAVRMGRVTPDQAVIPAVSQAVRAHGLSSFGVLLRGCLEPENIVLITIPG